mmetsp:Transcript_24137/g.74415  ORF Transcript_24137/g.74415 Transcript_24137/m.74415 type:complete len:205 (+) Transcript_24137:119-733(+)
MGTSPSSSSSATGCTWSRTAAASRPAFSEEAASTTPLFSPTGRRESELISEAAGGGKRVPVAEGWGSTRAGGLAGGQLVLWSRPRGASPSCRRSSTSEGGSAKCDRPSVGSTKACRCVTVSSGGSAKLPHGCALRGCRGGGDLFPLSVACGWRPGCIIIVGDFDPPSGWTTGATGAPPRAVIAVINGGAAASGVVVRAACWKKS